MMANGTGTPNTISLVFVRLIILFTSPYISKFISEGNIKIMLRYNEISVITHQHI